MVRQVLRVCISLRSKVRAGANDLILQTKTQKSQRRYWCARPECSERFATRHGRLRHLQANKECFSAWKPSYGPTEQAASSEVSSEVGSDEGCGYTGENYTYDTLVDVDIELDQLRWDGNGGEETEAIAFEDVDFTSSPSGIDLQSADLIDTPEPSIIAEEFLGAAEVFDLCKNRYVQLWESDKLYGLRKIAGPLYPFSGEMEFEVVDTVLQHLPMGRVDDFLKLDYVCLAFALQIHCL